jgi:hypothetical protein
MEARKLTLGLLLQAMGFVFLEYYDELTKASALRHQQRFHANALAKLIEADIAKLYKFLEEEKAPDTEYLPFYGAVDFLKECIETACSLSEQSSSPSGTIGVPILREILRLVRAGQWDHVDDLPEVIPADESHQVEQQ